MRRLDTSLFELNDEFSVSFILEFEMSISFMKLYERDNRSVGIAFWHIQFCTKYRYEMFSKFKYKSLMEACIRRVCCKHDIKIVAMYVMPDHVHLVVKTSTNVNPRKILFSLSRVDLHISSLGFILKADSGIPKDIFGVQVSLSLQLVSPTWTLPLLMSYIKRNTMVPLSSARLETKPFRAWRTSYYHILIACFVISMLQLLFLSQKFSHF